MSREQTTIGYWLQAAQQNTLALRIAGCSDGYGVALSVTGAAPAAVIAIFKTFNGDAATGLAPGVNVPGEAVFRSRRCAFVHESCVDDLLDAMQCCEDVSCAVAVALPPAALLLLAGAGWDPSMSSSEFA